MKTLTATSIIALVAFAGHASAQDLTFAAGSLNGGHVAIEGDEISSFSLDGDFELTYDKFVFGGSAKHQNYDFDGGDELAVTTYDAFAAYALSPEFMVGAGLTGIAVEDGSSFSGYEAFAQYDNGQYAAAVVYEKPTNENDDFDLTSVFGQAMLSPEVVVGAVIESVSVLEETLYYLSADYASGPISARGYYHGVTEIDAAIYGARGSYDFAQGFFATADLQRAEGFFGDGLETYAVGGGYHFNDTATIDASIGQMSVNNFDATVFQIGLTFEMGGRKRVDSVMSDAVRADLSSGLSLFAPDYGFGAGINFY